MGGPPAFVVRMADMVCDNSTRNGSNMYESEANYECLNVCLEAAYCTCVHRAISLFCDRVSLRIPKDERRPFLDDGHVPGPTNQPTVGDAAEINSGSHRSGAKLNFPFPESTPRTPRTPPTPRRERAQAHMGAHAPARTRTRALTLKLLLSGSRCVHCPFLTRSPSLPSLSRHRSVSRTRRIPNVDLQ